MSEQLFYLQQKWTVIYVKLLEEQQQKNKYIIKVAHMIHENNL